MARVFLSHSSRDNASAVRMKAWLEQQGLEAPFLDFDKHIGIPPGEDWEKTLYREIELSQALLILQSANWSASKWCDREFTCARHLSPAEAGPIWPTHAALCPAVAPLSQSSRLTSPRAGICAGDAPRLSAEACLYRDCIRRGLLRSATRWDYGSLRNHPEGDMEQSAKERAADLHERVLRLREALNAQQLSESLSSDWGNFGNEWGQGGGFDNKTHFENGY